MFMIKLAVANRMHDLKSFITNFKLVGPISLAVVVPWIMMRIFRAAWLRGAYNNLLDKVVVITGASSGLGEALAHEFYKHGAQVVLCSRRRQELERVRTDLLHSHCENTTHPPIIIPLDLTEYKDLNSHVDKIISITGKIDILVNNGGISHRGTVKDTKIETDEKIMSVNYFGAVALTKAVLPHMLRRKEGQIVFISSLQGLMALPDRSAYSASKHALQAFADSLRAEVASENVSVSVASPGYIKTQLSINALTGSGRVHGQMDSTTASGFEPKYAARAIVQAVVLGRKEIILSTLLGSIGILLRKFLPSVYFWAMERRARKIPFGEVQANGHGKML